MIANPTKSSAATDAPATEAPPTTAQLTINSLETQLVFPGSQSQGQAQARVQPGPGCELVNLRAPDGTTITALFGKVIHPHAATKPTLLYFYGNGMCMADSLDVFNRFRNLGLNVIMADYEGYGMSGGKPSEPGCYAAADAVYDYVLTRKDVDQQRIVVGGWSLGAAVAIDLASRRHIAGLVTFSAFTNINDMSKILLQDIPLPIQLNCHFDNLAKIASVTCPILMAHGARDPLVPPAMLERLANAAKTKATTIRVIGAEHNDIFHRGGDSLFGQVKAFIDGLRDASPATQPFQRTKT